MSKIISDHVEMVSSKLQEVYVFDAKKNDYFLLHYTFEGKKMSVVSKSIIKRIRLCEMLLAEVQGEEEEDVSAEAKRTPMIHKIRSPHQPRNDKSMPPKPMLNRPQQRWNKVEI